RAPRPCPRMRKPVQGSARPGNTAWKSPYRELHEANARFRSKFGRTGRYFAPFRPVSQALSPRRVYRHGQGAEAGGFRAAGAVGTPGVCTRPAGRHRPRFRLLRRHGSMTPVNARSPDQPSMDGASDEDLMLRIATGDEPAFRVLARRYAPLA